MFQKSILYSRFIKIGWEKFGKFMVISQIRQCLPPAKVSLHTIVCFDTYYILCCFILTKCENLFSTYTPTGLFANIWCDTYSMLVLFLINYLPCPGAGNWRCGQWWECLHNSKPLGWFLHYPSLY